ncbi:hypothetical protein LXA43DRAFT_60396 [Ganoderma leucocontextum]|nr:hypothetical protein LXA43DRAFT_60396 [Ganoderma leucocontextum]
MDQTSVVGGHLMLAQNPTHSTPNVDYAQRWGSPRPAPASVQPILSLPPRPSSSARLIGTYEAALTSYQDSLRRQIALRSQQLSEHASDLSSIHSRSDAVLREYAGEVQAAQARTNRALTDNHQMLQDIERTIAESRRSLGLRPLATIVSPAPIPVPPPLSRSAPPQATLTNEHSLAGEGRVYTSPPTTVGEPRTASLTHESNYAMPRLPAESLDEYDRRIGRMLRRRVKHGWLPLRSKHRHNRRECGILLIGVVPSPFRHALRVEIHRRGPGGRRLLLAPSNGHGRGHADGGADRGIRSGVLNACCDDGRGGDARRIDGLVFGVVGGGRLRHDSKSE